MSQIPESVRRRMQAQAVGDHLDADLLTAFAEQGLTGTERERVLLHLAACATCREIVSVSAPHQPLTTQELVAPPAASWFRWPVLRWTAVAATVIVVGAAVSVLLQRKTIDVSVPVSLPSPAASERQPAVKEPVEPNQYARHSASAKKPAPEPAKQEAQAEVADGKLKAQAAPPVQGAGREIAGMSSAAPMTVPITGQADATQAKAKAFDEESTKKEVARKDTPPAVVNGKDALVAGALGKLDRDVPADKIAAAAPAPPPSSAVAETRNEATTAMRHGAATGIAAGAPMRVTKARTTFASRWRVSSTGAVERSNDGNTWEKVDIDLGVTFRSISSSNGDLWAGGTGGALFHSSDAGLTWSRVKVGDEGMWVSDAITGVNFPTPGNGFVTTESGAVWTTQDGGHFWQRRQ